MRECESKLKLPLTQATASPKAITAYSEAHKSLKTNSKCHFYLSSRSRPKRTGSATPAPSPLVLQILVLFKSLSFNSLDSVFFLLNCLLLSPFPSYVFLHSVPSFSFSFAFCVLASPRRDDFQRNRLRKKRLENETENERMP